MTALTDLTLDELRPHLARAMLPHVPFDGWSPVAAAAAEADLGLAPGTARIAFPDGAADMIAAWISALDTDMAAALDTDAYRALKVRAKVTQAIRTRLELAAPHREALRRAVAVLALPGNFGTARRLSWRTADAIWRAAGDSSTDFNHYSKRALAASVYAATLLFYLQDDSEEHQDSWAFLDRRIADVMRIETLKARLKPRADRFSPLRALGRLRYPAEA